MGKSWGVKQIAEEITEQTGKRVDITDVRLLLFNPADPGDIPTTDSDKAFAVWIPPQIFQTDEAAKSLSAGLGELGIGNVPAFVQQRQKAGGRSRKASEQLPGR